MTEVAVESRPFTQVQNEELARLMAEYQAAQANVARFISYLRREYNAPEAEGYDQISVEDGFTKSGNTQTGGNFAGASSAPLLN